jgi:hypothetical protein
MWRGGPPPVYLKFAGGSTYDIEQLSSSIEHWLTCSLPAQEVAVIAKRRPAVEYSDSGKPIPQTPKPP